MADLIQAASGAVMGGLAVGFFNAVYMGSRITRLETLVKVIAEKLGIGS